MLVDELQRTLLGREGDVGDGGKHDDATDHRERLNPEEIVASHDSEIESSGERAAAKGDCSLKPTGAGDSRVSEEFGDAAFVSDRFDDLKFALGLIVHGRQLLGGGSRTKRKKHGRSSEAANLGYFLDLWIVSIAELEQQG